MELRPLGNTGLKVSAVGFGASPLGSHYSPVAQDDAIAAVRDHFFYSFTSSRHLSSSFHTVFYLLLMMRERSDEITSKYYGGTLSEKVLGKALKALQVSRGDYIVATKCGRYEEGFDFSAERSLENLQFTSLSLLVYYCLCQHLLIVVPLNIFTYVLDRVPLGTIDVILSYCHYSINDSKLLPYLKSKGVGVITASPLAMGLFTEQGPPEWHPASPEIKSACKFAVVHCKSKGKKIAKLALQYSLANKAISSVLVGMGSVSEVEENVQAFTELEGLGMDQETLSEVEAILEPIKNLTWPSGIDHK
ncbi:unnamed protein product [Brassica oleracea var. botrytis]|uniref:(rape) hypothetical protein n=1 Tax=Brassica napus TaxID=3708 RepID=A0A078GP17_BRANA|nr:unnamed protein product [Brassica napus]CDY28315.1 BnaC03g66440D [Brassica napus]